MNTQNISQFELLDAELLAAVEGGGGVLGVLGGAATYGATCWWVK